MEVKDVMGAILGYLFHNLWCFFAAAICCWDRTFRRFHHPCFWGHTGNLILGAIEISERALEEKRGEFATEVQQIYC